MKRTIEIVSSFTGKISVGQYENESPFFSLKETVEYENGEFTDEMMQARQKQLQDYCYQQFQKQAERAKFDRIKKEYQNIRFYEEDGKLYPSVTSITNWDADFRVPPDELQQYSARGTIIHKQVEIFLKTGEWKTPKQIPEIYPELVTLSQGSLSLSLDGYDFSQFYKDYPFKVLAQEERVINREEVYAGRLDIRGIIESSNRGKWDKVEGLLYDVETVFDIKTGTIDKTKHMMQQTAYAHCNDSIKQMVLIPLTSENKCGYAKPVVEIDKDKYWHLFKRERDNFKKRYGV